MYLSYRILYNAILQYLNNRLYKENNMTSKNITVNVDTKTYKEIQRKAVEEETSIKKIINKYLADGLKNDKGQTKLD